MGDLVGERVFVGEAAAVVQDVAAALALHASPADPAVQQPTHDVRVAGALPLAGRTASALACQQVLGVLEGLGVDQRRVGLVGGPDPGIRPVPAQPGLVSEGHVVDVEEDLFLVLLVPDLPSGVAGVGQDRADGPLGPGDAAAVPVAPRVVRGRARDAVAGQGLGNGEQPAPGAVVAEDALDDVRGGGVRFQSVQALAVGGLGRVRVGSDVGEPVTVGRSPAQVASFDLGLGGHGGADPDLDPVAFPLAHAAEDRHHQVVGFGFRIDRAADLRHPEPHSVVNEEREDQSVLVAVEGPLRFADDHRVEAAVRLLQCFEERRGSGPTLPWDRAGLADVEVLGDDDAVRLDQCLGAGELPVA
ncbi:hypothetical protein OHT21_07740 [Streptomyces sp. NBC_00286]|nr:hypothetical protein [Streptomyces sp. NBC_00286]